MSPIIDAFGGVLKKTYECIVCKQSRDVVENRFSLNFDRLDRSEIQKVRQTFEEKGYTEGLVYKQVQAKNSSLISKLMMKSTRKVPLLTLRDYFCHLNFTLGDLK